MRVVYSKEFLKAVADLPTQIQSRLDERIALLTEDPFHPLLHSKRLKGILKDYHSFRITREWRAIFSLADSDTIMLVNVAHRKDLYR